MADIKLFNISGEVKEYQSGTVTLEKELKLLLKPIWRLSLALLSSLQSIAPRTADAWIVSALMKIIALSFLNTSGL